MNAPGLVRQDGKRLGRHVGEGRLDQRERVRVPPVRLAVHRRLRRRQIGARDERFVDPRLRQQLVEHRAVGVAGDRAEERHRDVEATERDRGVERPPACNGPPRLAVLDEIDERLAPDDDHEAAGAVGAISPEPRAINSTGSTSCTGGEVSPSRRRKS